MDEPSKAVWNLNELLERVENDQELLRELLGVFKEDFPRTMNLLESAVAQGDTKVARPLSHTLKGMLGNLGAARAAAVAAELEKTAASGNASALSTTWKNLRTESASLLSEVDAYLAEVRR